MSYNKVEEQINFLKKSGQILDEYLDFYYNILTIQLTHKQYINKDTLSILCKTADIDNRLSEGLPLLEKSNFYIDDKYLELFYQELLSVLEQYRQQVGTDEFIKLKNTRLNKSFKLKELLRSFISENKEYFDMLAFDINIKQGLLIFIAKTISLPLLELYGEILKPYLAKTDDSWLRPYCPLCGNTPGMARLEKEVGQRFLWCSVCDTQWIFSRIQCPFCLSTEQTQLRYFYTEEEDPYRVYVCENCKRYIKTIDERKLNGERKVYIAVEDLITLYLDQLAVKEGYRSALWWMEFNNV